jgi:hypothetical protein
LAAGLAAMGFASQAFATEANPTGAQIHLTGAAMVQTYTANVGTTANHRVDAFSNGVTFSYQNWNPALNGGLGGPAPATVYTLFGFCVDITHDMSLGGLNMVYSDNFGVNGVADPLPTDFHGGVISQTTLSALNNLIDTGWLLHESQIGQTSAYINNVDLQLAAIQAAIWTVEGGNVTLNGGSSTAGANVGGAIAGGAALTYAQYYTDYSTGAYHSLADANDRFYTIVEVNPYDGHQSFAIGWPLPGVPEPTTWAMMLTGFFGMGSMLRSRRKLARAAI